MVTMHPRGSTKPQRHFALTKACRDVVRQVAGQWRRRSVVSLASDSHYALEQLENRTLLSVSTVAVLTQPAPAEESTSQLHFYSVAGTSQQKPAAGGDPLVVTTQPPATIAAGAPFGMVVTAENDDGTTNTTFTGLITVGNYDGPIGGTLSVNPVNGVATFTGLTLDQSGDNQLYVSSDTEATVSPNDVTVTPLAATQLSAAAPSGVLTNAPFGVTVNAEDPYGNIDTSFSGNVTLAMGANPSGAALGGTLTVAAASGVATFSNLTLSKLGNGYTLNATSSGLSGSATLAFDVSDQLAVTTQPPASVAAGSSFGLSVSAEDGLGNVDTSFTGSVTVSDAYGSPLGGTLTVTAVNGVATFSGLTIDQSGSSQLSASGVDAAQGFSNSFNVTPLAASQLSALSPGTVLTNSPFGLTVNAEDKYGNIDTNFSGNVTVALGSNPGSATLGGTLTVAAVSGVATFSNLTISKMANGYTLKATSSGLSSSTTPAFTASDQLVVTTQPPASVAAGSTFSVAFSAEDGLGNVDTSFTGSVTLSDGYGFPLGGTLTVNAVSGVATFSNLTEDTDGPQDLTANAAHLSPSYSSATTDGFTVTPMTASQLVASTPGTALTNAPFGLTVNAEDQYGNIDTSFSGNVTLALGSNPSGATLGGTLTVAAVSGVATFSNLTLNKMDSGYTLNATSSGLTSSTTTAFDVSDQLVVTTQPAASVAAGNPFGVAVSAEDGLGNVDTSFTGSVTVGDGYGYPLGGTLTMSAVSGVATFSDLTESTPGPQDLTASAPDLSPAYASVNTNSFTVTPVTATQLVASAPSGVLTNAPFALTVNAEDQYGNTDTNFSGNVTLALGANPSGAALGGTLTVAAVDGVASFSNLTLSKIGNGYTLNATSSGLSSSATPAFDVSDQLAVTTQPPASVTAGSPFGLIVSAEDGLGNVDTNFTGSVTVSDSYGYPVGGTVTVSAVNGVATFSGLTVNQSGTSQLSISGTDAATALSNSFNVTPLAASELLASGPGTVLTNAPFSLTVNAEDKYGNIATNFSGNVTVALGSNPGGATLGGTLTAAAVNGVATFSNLTVNKMANGYTLKATSSGLTSSTTPAFSASDQLVVTTQPPASVAAGSTFGTVFSAEDGLGNVDTSFTGSVTVSDGASYPLGGTLTVKAVSGVATFSGLTESTTGSQDLVANAAHLSGAYSSATTSSFTVTPLAASQLIASAPGTALTNAPFSLTVNAEDEYGNIDTNFSGNVTVALGSNPSGATLGGTLTVAAVSGVATFSNLTVNKMDSGYTLKATSSGLTSSTTTAFDVSDQLVVTTQPPASVAAGSQFGVAVSAEDGLGNVDTSFTGSVTVSDGNGYALGGTLTTGAVNGVASFSDLTESTPGPQNLVLNAPDLSPSYASANTDSFNVTPATGTQLIASAPSGVLTNAPFALTVNAEDQYGNIDTNFSGNVTLALGANPSGATLGGTLTVAAVNGVASFSNLTLSKIGNGYTLNATSSGLSSSATPAFDVTDQLAVTTQPPASVTAGSPFGLIVSAEDGLGNVDTNFTGSVTVSDYYGYPLGGTLTVTAVKGVASLTAGITISQAGTSPLEADAFDASSAVTNPVTVTGTPSGVTVVAGASGYSETSGTWATSSRLGYNNTESRYSTTASASAKWTPTLTAGFYTVSFYNLIVSGDTTSAKVSVLANGATTSQTITQATGTSGLISLGTFYFNGSGNESVSLTNLSSGELRANAVQFTPTQSSTTTTLTKNTTAPVKYGQSVTFTATMVGAIPGGTPTGTVTFEDGTTVLGTGTASGGIATFTTTLPLGSNSVKAIYGGDANFTGSTSGSVSQTVSQAATTTTLTKNTTAPITFGQSVTLTAKPAAVSPGSGTPTGTVTFMDGATVLGTAALSSGVAKLTTTALPAGSNSLTAVYGGDADFTTSTSAALSQTVTQSATKTTLTQSSATITYGQSVTFTATAAAVSPGAGTPTGTVTFKSGTTVLGTAALSGGVAKLTSTTVPAGSDSITAVYSGDTNFTTSTSAAVTETVNKSATTTKLAKSTTAAITFGQSVTLTATLAAVSPGAGTPTGTVTFMDNGSSIGTAALSGGIATLTTTTIPAGSNSITAVYAGDANFTTSTSSALTQTVHQSATTTALTQNTAAAKFGQSVTFTATMAAVSPGAGTPTGTVTFKDGSTVLGTGTLTNGIAKFATSSLAVGSHSITAVYGGDTNFTTSTSGVLTQTVNQASTTTKLTKNTTAAIKSGVSVTFTATLAAVSPGSGTPTGTVTFMDNGSSIGTATLSGNVATLATSTLPVGSNSITAVYGGDVNFTTSTSSALSQTVTS